MNIHEYQSKALFEQFGIPIPQGWVFDRNNVNTAEEQISSYPKVSLWAIKAQIYAGGRGKGTFIENNSHGVQFAKTPAAVRQCIDRMLGNTLVTHQTGPKGRQVHKVYVTEGVDVERQFYVSIVIDRNRQCPVLMASAEGGMEIETLAQNAPEKIIQIPIDVLLGLTTYQARRVAYFFNLAEEYIAECIRLLMNVYRLFQETDAMLVEINPLCITKDGRLCALDAKVQLDDNALFRHPEFVEFEDVNEKDPKEVLAGHAHLNYIALDGNIACLVNGAGLAMATMDIIQHFGGQPANFLDVGGGANSEQIEMALKIILQDPHVKGIFVNVFGGILRCDMLAQSIVDAAHKVQLNLPLVLRVQGTNAEKAKEILAQSDLKLISVNDLAEATQMIVKCVQGGAK